MIRPPYALKSMFYFILIQKSAADPYYGETFELHQGGYSRGSFSLKVRLAEHGIQSERWHSGSGELFSKLYRRFGSSRRQPRSPCLCKVCVEFLEATSQSYTGKVHVVAPSRYVHTPYVLAKAWPSRRYIPKKRMWHVRSLAWWLKTRSGTRRRCFGCFRSPIWFKA